MALDFLPTEILHSIMDELDLNDHRRLRLVCSRLNTIASSRTMKNLDFFLCKPDFDMLQSIADRNGEHVTSLIYVATMVSSKRHDFDAYNQLIRRDWDYEHLEMIDADPRGYFEHYERAYESQQDILAHDRDYQLLESVLAKLPNLDRIVVWSQHQGQAEISVEPATRRMYNHGRLGVCERSVCITGVDYGDGAARHLRALLRGVQTAGTKLRTIIATGMHYSFFDPEQFGLASVAPHLFENLSCLELSIEALADWDYDHYNNQQEKFILMPHVTDASACRATMQKGMLRKALLNMPNLTRLRLIVIGVLRDWELALADGRSCHPPDFEDMVSPEQSWPRLKSLTLEGMYASQEQLAGLIIRCRETLTSVELNRVRMTNGSWRKLLPQLKEGIAGRKIDVALGWDLEDWSGGVRMKDWVRRGGRTAVQDYFGDPSVSKIPLEDGARASLRDLLEGFEDVPSSDEAWSDED
ncbi:hypothetical protein QBC34DRAFT_438710 [Podospora aff. communis PSN243]|uniref:F-box domain-containing protein n=1 Tax=Podospora aff. communis PSN243 TaxID=3040156 RepID=A0AAV9GMI1_9PEZI|nr:hypothetical protein QBC34DRAFT_438710 [Podospora aff. communis PSN243]